MMRKYFTFKCVGCHFSDTYMVEFTPIGGYLDSPCPCCGSLLQRSASFFYKHSMQPHFNNATGEYVTGERNFKDALKRKSEEMTVRTGMEHNYAPVDLREKDALGVTDEGLDETRKRLHDTGQETSGKKIIV